MFQQQCKEDKNGVFNYYPGFRTSPLLNSWGNHEKEISFSSAEKAIQERYEVTISKLTYKGYRVGDIPIIWNGGLCSIY